MNILIAADYSTPASGNFIGSLFDLGKDLKNDNHNLYFIFPEAPNTLSDNSWVRWLENSGFKVFLTKHKTGDESFTFLKSVIDENNIDILHLHFGMYHRIALDCAKSLGVEIIIHDHMEFSPRESLIKQKAYCALTSLKYRINKIRIVCVKKMQCLPFCRTGFHT